MKKILSAGIAVGLFVFGLTGLSSAAVIAEDYTQLSVTGENYIDSFSVTDNYTNVVLDLTASGDYGHTNNEWIRFYIDGTLIADWTYDTPGISSTENVHAYDYTLTGSITISDSLFSSLISDDTLTISWQNGHRVDVFHDIGGTDYVSWSLTGDTAPIPEPATLLLLGTGLAGLVGTRLRRKKN